MSARIAHHGAKYVRIVWKYLESVSVEQDALSKHAAVVLEPRDHRSKHRDDRSCEPACREKHVSVVSDCRGDGSKSRAVASFRRWHCSV